MSMVGGGIGLRGIFLLDFYGDCNKIDVYCNNITKFVKREYEMIASQVQLCHN